MAISKNTPEVKAAIVESVRNGAYAKHAAQAAGISEASLYAWLADEPDFAGALEKAKADRTNAAIQRIAVHGERHWQADAWLLERTSPDDFRQRTTSELTGANGGPIEVAEVPLDADRAAAVAAILKSTGAAG
jgi:transposase-like protein